MIKNENGIDRVVIAIAALVGAFAMGFSGWLAWVLVAVAAIMAITAAVGFCPLYRVFGISTCKVDTTAPRTKVAA